MNNNVFDELKWRGLLYDSTEGMEEKLVNEKVTIYTGFDPTGDSLHVGSLVPIMGLARLQKFGHTPIALAGGGTGMIGDPSGKSATRPALTPLQISENAETYQKQVFKILDPETTEICFNSNWHGPRSSADMIRLASRHTVARMLERDDFSKRSKNNQPI